MNQTITLGSGDEIQVDADFGYPQGVKVDGLHIHLNGRALDEMIATLEAVRREREDMQRVADGEMTEAEYFGQWNADTGPELAGFESEVA